LFKTFGVWLDFSGNWIKVEVEDLCLPKSR
jgi:hypothetical protein